VAQPGRLAAAYEAAICSFRELRPGTETLVNAEVNTHHKEIWIRVVQNGRSDWDRIGQVEESLQPSLKSLRSITEQSGGALHYWGGNNYFDVSLLYPEADRDDLLDVKHLPWDEQYRVRLERESWPSLRHMVFRFADLASKLAGRCQTRGMTSAVIPSVGLCVHPWLFASHGLTVTTTDAAATALAALAEPARYPNLYSTAAYERWDTSTCASFAMIPHPNHFDGMPALEVDEVREALQRRITFVATDWRHLPNPSGTVDLVFATNAVPRGSAAERMAVLEEWIRILRPGGFAYIAQHHAAADWGVESFFLKRGFREYDFLRGEEPSNGARGGFQVLYSSG
jgi:SAM-dependent methyltransferase